MHNHYNPEDQVIVDFYVDNQVTHTISVPWFVDWISDIPHYETLCHNQTIIQAAIDKVTRETRSFEFADSIKKYINENRMNFRITLNDVVYREDVRFEVVYVISE